jgi:hypothetical protein
MPKSSQIPWIQNYFNSLQGDMSLTNEDKLLTHPLHKTIHRKVYIDPTMDSKKTIATAKGTEYNAFYNSNDDNWKIDMDKSGMGMSCSNKCNCLEFAKGGVYPFQLVRDNIKNVKIEKNHSVYVGGHEVGVVRCYHRNVDFTGQNAKVGEALLLHGKDDRFLIQPNFAFYWDKKNHGIICLRKEITVEKSCIDTQDIITFDEFQIDSWTICKEYYGLKNSKKTP